MNDPARRGSSGWRLVAEVSGLRRAADLPLLGWPLLWAAWFATAGSPSPSRLLALGLAALLARGACWAAYAPEAEAVGRIPRERHFLIALFAIGALCFALPLGWAGLPVVAALLLAAGWFHLRQDSYLSDPLLAVALTLPGVAAWLSQGAGWSKAGGLIWLAALLWLLSALMVLPAARQGATLALLAGPHGHGATLLLKVGAVAALTAAGYQASLGVFFWLGLAAAAGLALYQFATARRTSPPAPAVLEAWWGGAVFCAVAFHFLCVGEAAAP